MVTVTTQCLLSVTPSSSHFSPAPAWTLHGLLPFMKKICPSMGSSSTMEQREDFMCLLLLLPLCVFPVLFLTLFFFISSSSCLSVCAPGCPKVRCHHLGCGSQPCPVVGPLEQAGACMGQPPDPCLCQGIHTQ